MADPSMPLDPSSQPEIRLSDADREQMALFLRNHATEGRLTMLELEDRLDIVYGARIRADLVPVTEGLPVTIPTRSAAPAVKTDRPARNRVHADSRTTTQSFTHHLRVYLMVMAFLVALYAVTDFGGYFWPIWPGLGWGLGVGLHGVNRSR